jgi:hypothetical protein
LLTVRNFLLYEVGNPKLTVFASRFALLRWLAVACQAGQLSCITRLPMKDIWTNSEQSAKMLDKAAHPVYSQEALSMSRNLIRRSTLLVLAALAIPAVIFAGALPANAVSNPHLCETYGSYCLGSQPDIALYRVITESSPGRDLLLTPLGGSYDGYPTYLIQFSADPSHCVGTDGANVVMIQPCNTGTGIVWAQEYIGTNNGNLAVYQYINRNASNYYGEKEYLSGVDRLGAQYYTRPSGRSGVYYKFSWES